MRSALHAPGRPRGGGGRWPPRATTSPVHGVRADRRARGSSERDLGDPGGRLGRWSTVHGSAHGCEKAADGPSPMHLLDFFIGLATGLAFAALALQRVRAERAVTQAARTLEHDAKTQLVVSRERHAAELQ